MDRNRALGCGLLVAAAVLVAACNDGESAAMPAVDGVTTTIAGPPPTSAPSTTSVGMTIGMTIDDADFGWALDGDGSARSGGVDVEFQGAYETTDEAVSFDGYTGHALTPGPSPVDTTESFTLMAWANYADPTTRSAVVGLLGADSYAAVLSVGGEGVWEFTTKTRDVTGGEFATSAVGDEPESGDTWTHLAGVYDAASATTSLYVDGELVGQASAPPLFDAQGPLTIGRGQFDGGPGNYWRGAIGDVAVFQRALSADEVASLYEATQPASPPPPIPSPDPSTYGDGLLNGTWDYVYDDEQAQLIIEDFSEFVDDADEVIVRIGFDDSEFWIGFLFDGVMPMYGKSPEGAGGTFTINDDILTTDEGFGTSDLRFSLDGDQLTLEFLQGCERGGDCTDVGDPLGLAVINHTFTKSSDDPRRYDK